MPTFSYRARDAQGNLVQGTLESLDRASAIQAIEQKRCVPVKIEPLALSGTATSPTSQPPTAKASSPSRRTDKRENQTNATPSLGSNSTTHSKPVGTTELAAATSSQRLSHGQRLFFTEQLAYLLSAGMTLDEALGVLVRRLKQVDLQKLTKALHQGLLEGRSFSQTLRVFPRIFSPLYTNLVMAGEASGALEDILTRLVSHLTNMKKMRDTVSQALIYPAFLVMAGVGLVVIFITVMVPRLQSFFASSNGGPVLPLPTRMLIAANDLIVAYWWAAAAAVMLGILIFKLATRSAEGLMRWDRFRLSIPAYGSVVRFQFYAQFARTLGTLLQNGVTLLRAIELLEDMSGNTYLKARMAEARASLVDGSSLSNALSKHKIFPELFVDMMAVGEQSGKFAETMQMIATVYERELDQRVKAATAVIPPIIIIVIAVLVGAVVYGIISAVFSVTSGLQHSARLSVLLCLSAGLLYVQAISPCLQVYNLTPTIPDILRVVRIIYKYVHNVTSIRPISRDQRIPIIWKGELK